MHQHGGVRRFEQLATDRWRGRILALRLLEPGVEGLRTLPYGVAMQPGFSVIHM